MPICRGVTFDRYLGLVHVCGLPYDQRPTHVHHCSLKERGSDCDYGWIEGMKTTAHEDWLSWGWRLAP